MIDRYEAHRKEAVARVLGSAGDTPRFLRETVLAKAARLGGRTSAEPADVPTPLATYVERVATEAHKVTDEDVVALRRAGYSEDAVFEITLCAALGTALGRLERGMDALHGRTHAAP